MALSRAGLEALLDGFEPALRIAFLSAVDNLRSGAELDRLVTMIEARDIEAALRALNLEPSAINPLVEAFRASFNASGSALADSLPARVIIRFDGRNVRAEAWLASYAADFVTNILEDQRTSVRSAVVAGMERGENPRTTALDIVGRVNPKSGKREGGVIGLTAAQERYVQSYQAALASTDPGILADALQRARRDKRFDSSVKKAIASGEGVDRTTAAKMVQRYRDRLLQLRGETIARTEALTALNAGQEEALQQAVDRGSIRASQVQKIWRSASDNRVRDTHADLNGKSVGLNERFTSLSGARLRFPGDPEAPVGERAGCRCIVESKIDFLSGVT